MNKNIVIEREVVGNYLSSLRKSKGITKYRVSKETGLKFDAINAIENGSKAYTIDSLLKYSAGLGVHLFFENN